MDLKMIGDVLAARFMGRPTPIYLTFELTHLCNLACYYCDRHTPLPNEMTREQIFAALEEFLELGTRHVSIDGGEPLAHKHIDEIVVWLTDRGITVRMNSNGILVPRKKDTVRRLNMLKISLDGTRENHDSMRGKGAFDRAVQGALCAREWGVEVQFTCVVGCHNVDILDNLIDFAEEQRFVIIFQPARNSLFLDSDRDGSAWQLDDRMLRRAFAKIEERKRRSPAIGNGWGSLRHYRTFPEDTPLPCNAGWIQVALDPEGNLFHCGQVSRSNCSNNVVKLGVRKAFEGLPRKGCSQCWCARTIEGNYKWGIRIDRMLPPLSHTRQEV